MKSKLYMKNLILFLTVAFICLTGNAQSSDIANSINKIKRDKSYFYAESTSASEAEAKDAATVMLQSIVSDHNKQSGSSIDYNSLDVQYLQMMRGEYYRVFAYARKDGAKTTAVKISETAQPKPEKAQVKVFEPAPAPKVKEAQQPVVNNNLNTQNDNLQQELSEKDRQLKELQEQLEAQRRENERLVQLSKENNPTANNTSTTYNQPAQSSTMSGLNQYQQNVIDALLQCANLKDVSDKLSRFQNEYKIKKYGTYDDCPNIASCYWIVLNRDSEMSMNTILSTGNDKTNLKTSQYDSLSKYTGYILIWFRL